MNRNSILSYNFQQPAFNSSIKAEDKRTKIVKEDEKLKISQKFASEDIVAPKNFDYKNYFQMK